MLSNKLSTQLSIYLSLVLRHKPEELEIILDENGWTHVPTLLDKLNATGRVCELTDLQRIVDEDEKGRYRFDDAFQYIRAVQGHSHASVKGMQHELATPPAILYHGTPASNRESIDRKGISRQQRLYVHLTDDREQAWKSATRRKTDGIVYAIDTVKMLRMGMVFYRADNGVWLTKRVPFCALSVHGHDEAAFITPVVGNNETSS
jgi:RNA:NAD 2'-phosphotransferase